MFLQLKVEKGYWNLIDESCIILDINSRPLPSSPVIKTETIELIAFLTNKTTFLIAFDSETISDIATEVLTPRLASDL